MSEAVKEKKQRRTKPELENDAQIAALPLPTEKPQEVYHRTLEGGRDLEGGRALMLLVGRSGSKRWRVVWYEPVAHRRTGVVQMQPRSKTLMVKVGKGKDAPLVPATFPAVKLAKAKALAVAFNVDAMQKQAAAKQAAVQAKATHGETFGAVADGWLKGYVAVRKLRTAKELERHLTYYVFPDWHDRPIADIDKDAVKALIKKIAKDNGPPQAAAVLMSIRGVFKWFKAWGKLPDGWRLDDVIDSSMKPDVRKAEQKERKRVLKPVEVQALWRATEAPTPFNGLVRFLLLTTVRLSKAQHLRHADIVDGVWTIRVEENEKATAGQLRLPALALREVAKQRRLPGNPYVFAGERGGSSTTSVIRPKAELVQRMQEFLPDGFAMEHWQLHDLRRTGRTYLARLGVDVDVAERILGHTRPKLVRNYSPDLAADERSFFDELPDAEEERKAEALRKLADLISRIVKPAAPDATNVVQLHPAETTHG